MKNSKSVIRIFMCVIMLFSGLTIVQANEPKPKVRLDVRSEKQAIVRIQDQRLTSLKEDVVYLFRLGNYEAKITWEVAKAENSYSAYGDLSYFEYSDNSHAYVNHEYPNGQLACYAEKLNKDTLELKMDFSGADLRIGSSESPRDLSAYLRNIDFSKLGDTLELIVQYDGDLNNYINDEFSYQKDEFFYDKMKGLFFTIERPSIGFDIKQDFGRAAGLTEEEITALYWTPTTDNYLILKTRELQKYSFGAESYEGMADIYDMICFDENNTIVSVKQKFVFDDEGGYSAHFRNVETDPNYNIMLERCIGVTADYNETSENKNMSFTVLASHVIAGMKNSGDTKDSILSKTSPDIQVIENHS